MSETFEGSCHCGAVRFRLMSRPMFTHCCHCRDCQKQTGGAFAINALIETSRIEMLKGEPVACSMRTESGRPHDIYRCDACGVALWSDYGRRRYLSFVRVSTLDRADEIEPDVHIYTRSKLKWVAIPDGARAFEEYYDMKQEWPPDSLERRKAASDAARA